MHSAQEIRQKFLDFFKSKQHNVVPSAPIVLKDDPTLMFTNAGMNQFKDIFLGNKKADYPRVADTQKCLRVSGKHNDLEEVGHDTYHHTMFEMLGNWSFGDYFKEEAIDFAWELLTDVYGIDKDRLYASVFKGDEKEGIPEDSEAIEFWKKYLPEKRILKYDKKDNFWEMGETGPSGPCSEIHVDLRSDEDRSKIDGSTLVNADHPQVIEVWNLVFIQYNRKADRSLELLPAKHVDTGMGLERLCAVLQNKPSTYDTDLFQPLFHKMKELSGIEYGKSEETDIALRVCVDHIRALAFGIADGQLPTNTGAGYVLRRILRRAVRYGYSYLNLNKPFFNELIPILSKQFEGVFDELKSQKEFIQKVILEEERSFLATLSAGLKKLDTIENTLQLNGAFVFELYDTYGFPVDLTRLIASEKGMTIDEAGFKNEMQKQKDRSKADAEKTSGDWVEIKSFDCDSKYVGYKNFEARDHIEAYVSMYRVQSSKGKKYFQVILNQTPFYAESGGQVGDTGIFEIDGKDYQVFDTKKEGSTIIHYLNEFPEEQAHQTVTAKVDYKRLYKVASNHSATHLLHAALRNILGDHVEQKGSLVAPDYLRFDFSHFSKVSEEDLKRIENEVNQKIRENILLTEHVNVPKEKALEMGAMALFGEKYEDKVRVIVFDPEYSVELCGGCHVQATGKIGWFKIVSESAVAAGVRRIEALTGEKAQEYVEKHFKLLDALKGVLKNDKDVLAGAKSVMNQNQQLEEALKTANAIQEKAIKEELIKSAEKLGELNFIGKTIRVSSPDSLKNILFQMRQETQNLIAVLGAEINQKATLAVIIDDELVKQKELNADQLIREAAKEIQGGGGGQPFFATAGGSNPNGLENAIHRIKKMVETQIN